MKVKLSPGKRAYVVSAWLTPSYKLLKQCRNPQSCISNNNYNFGLQRFRSINKGSNPLCMRAVRYFVQHRERDRGRPIHTNNLIYDYAAFMHLDFSF